MIDLILNINDTNAMYIFIVVVILTYIISFALGYIIGYKDQKASQVHYELYKFKREDD